MNSYDRTEWLQIAVQMQLETLNTGYVRCVACTELMEQKDDISRRNKTGSKETTPQRT